MNYGWIAAGGAAGAVARWGVGEAFAGAGISGGFPFATLAVNLLGAFVLGYAFGRWFGRWRASAWYQAATTGFLGAFTTMSAFGVEAALLLSDGRGAAAALYIGASFAAGPALAWAGMRRQAAV